MLVIVCIASFLLIVAQDCGHTFLEQPLSPFMASSSSTLISHCRLHPLSRQYWPTSRAIIRCHHGKSILSSSWDLESTCVQPLVLASNALNVASVLLGSWPAMLWWLHKSCQVFRPAMFWLLLHPSWQLSWPVDYPGQPAMLWMLRLQPTKLLLYWPVDYPGQQQSLSAAACSTVILGLRLSLPVDYSILASNLWMLRLAQLIAWSFDQCSECCAMPSESIMLLRFHFVHLAIHNHLE